MKYYNPSRRSLLVGGGALLALGTTVLASPASGAEVESTAATPADAWRRLLRGNQRFVTGHSRHPHQGLEDLHRLAAGQHPFAVTIGCADSRVTPEILFDQGLGDLFDNRVAGNVIDDLLLGSVEFAVEEFGTPLILVLGHERCGAITATIDAIRSGSPAPGHIGTIIDSLRPIVEPVLSQPGGMVENAVGANIGAQVRALLERSSIVAERVHKGTLRIVGARYDLDNGMVTVVA
ncbi:carbonic anhydrase [Micromonospora sp. 4G55]|uniref:carbonic anhydrase n=1 Tax=Micromonospora sp. 4G55 TaxID=2806102 RepID=UPI001A4C54CF|nr:carbonic anhydrase [Micromonospora sp. 4G55]MBM0256073.1 carbonic anhydrase [Micromonospora sp. 4G55]